MSQKRKKLRRVIIAIELAIICRIWWLIQCGFVIYGWKMLLHILGSAAAAIVIYAWYFFLAESKDHRWRREEAQRAADKMAGINIQLSKLYPGEDYKGDNIRLSRWYKTDDEIMKQYLIRYRSVKATPANMETANWCYRLGWYRQAQYSQERLEGLEEYINELEEQLADVQSQNSVLRSQNMEPHGLEEGLELLEPEQRSPSADNLEEQIKELLRNGITQTEIAQRLGTSQAKVSRVKRKMEEGDLWKRQE